MEPTNPDQTHSVNSLSNSADKGEEAHKKASLKEIYEYITGPYYALFIIGAIAAVAGGMCFTLFSILDLTNNANSKHYSIWL